MAEYHFYGMVSRMKYIARWGLMRNNRTENLSEHALEVAMIAHGLGAVRNRLYGGRVDIQSAEGRGTTVTAVLRRER